MTTENALQELQQLRTRILGLNPEKIGTTEESDPRPVFALLMEVGFPEGSFLLSAEANGTANLCFSSGSSVFGSEKDEGVLKASEGLLAGARLYYKRTQKVTVYPQAKPDQVAFYFITFEGIYSYIQEEKTLASEKDPLSNLYMTAHKVITELRKVDQANSLRKAVAKKES